MTSYGRYKMQRCTHTQKNVAMDRLVYRAPSRVDGAGQRGGGGHFFFVQQAATYVSTFVGGVGLD